MGGTCKHVLGIQLGATENAAAVKDLLSQLWQIRYLFVIDDFLRAGIEEVFGSNQLVQRCRTHKLRNVAEPKGLLANQVRSLMRAAWRLEPRKGRIKKARWDDRVSIIRQQPPACAKGWRRPLRSIRRSSQPPPLPGNHEPHRERAEKDWQCLPLARR